MHVTFILTLDKGRSIINSTSFIWNNTFNWHLKSIIINTGIYHYQNITACEHIELQKNPYSMYVISLHTILIRLNVWFWPSLSEIMNKISVRIEVKGILSRSNNNELYPQFMQMNNRSWIQDDISWQLGSV